ncbi:MAG: SRPBCC domain-containing protein, partial [Dehalococcoidia bacterium]
MTDQPMGPFIDRYTIRCDRFYPHPARRVWEAVTRTEHLAAWLSPGTRVDARPGGRFRFAAGGPMDGTVAGSIAEFRPYEVVDYTFDAGGCIRFELSPVPGGTRLVITHSAPPNTPGPDSSDQPSDDLDLPRGSGKPRYPGIDGSTVFRTIWRIAESIDRIDRIDRSRTAPNAPGDGARTRHRGQRVDRRVRR